MPSISASMSYSLCRSGSITIRPASSRTSTGSSSSSGMACITAAGIRTAALLPHFFTTLFMIHDDPYPFIRQIAPTCQQCRYGSSTDNSNFRGRRSKIREKVWRFFGELEHARRGGDIFSSMMDSELREHIQKSALDKQL